MNFFFFLLYLCFQKYNNQLCEKINSCYYCYISNNSCIWFNNSCYFQNSKLFQVINNQNIGSFLSYPFITFQYNCITNKNDIESFKDLKNSTISLIITPNKLGKVQFMGKINYHIYCLEYKSISNMLLSLEYNKSSINNIIHLSIYDNLTNNDQIINLGVNNDKINIQSNYVCIKITYRIDNSISKIISIHINEYDEYNSIKNKNDNIASYITLICIILLIIIIIWIFIICHRYKSGIMKEITIINKVNIYHRQENETNENGEKEEKEKKEEKEEKDNYFDKSNISELQEKYVQLEQKRFVEHNYETLNSFVKNIHDIDKKNIYLKTIIKTFPTFLIGVNNLDFIGSICSFCENKIKFNDNVCILNCGHIFHYDCIYQQIITNEEYNCIICKENIII